ALTNPAGVVAPPTKPVVCTCAPPSGGTCTAAPSGCTCSAPVNNACTPLPAGLSQQGLCASGLSTANRIGVQTPNGSTQQAAVLFISYGMSGAGSFVASPIPSFVNGSRLQFSSSVTCTPTGGYAACNQNGSGQFINASFSPSYDNMMLFADRN